LFILLGTAPAVAEDDAQLRADWVQLRSDWAQLRTDWAQLRSEWAQLRKDDTQIRSDWAQLGRYAAANAKLPSPASDARVVFFGDSITEGWSLTQSFPSKPYVNRGISGQTTPQMLVRFRQDVLNLQPRAVVILAGTNDIAQNTGAESLEQIEGYLTSMCELARANNVRVVLASVLPVLDYPWRPGLRPGPKVTALNTWLRDYAQKNKLVYLDYFSAMADANHAMRPELSEDGVHPNAAGYAVMTPLAANAIADALK
jgi:lysophospholipase L1-like esterase